MKTIGVLALQGAFQAHRAHIEALGCQYRSVRNRKDFMDLDGLIIPGGESSTMLKLLKVLEMEDALAEALEKLPAWGICAGAILMSAEVLGRSQKSFAAVEISISRNAYGRQLDSFCTEIDSYEVAFIRAPILEDPLDSRVEVLSRFNDKAVWVRQGNKMLTSFHPEINPQLPSPMHRYFIENLVGTSASETQPRVRDEAVSDPTPWSAPTP